MGHVKDYTYLGTVLTK